MRGLYSPFAARARGALHRTWSWRRLALSFKDRGGSSSSKSRQLSPSLFKYDVRAGVLRRRPGLPLSVQYSIQLQHSIKKRCSRPVPYEYSYTSTTWYRTSTCTLAQRCNSYYKQASSSLFSLPAPPPSSSLRSSLRLYPPPSVVHSYQAPSAIRCPFPTSPALPHLTTLPIHLRVPKNEPPTSTIQ